MPEGDLGKEIESKFDAGEEILVSVVKAANLQMSLSISSYLNVNSLPWNLFMFLSRSLSCLL